MVCRERQRCRLVRKMFLRENKLPSEAPSGQPLRWSICVVYLGDEVALQKDKLNRLTKDSRSKQVDTCDCGEHFLELVVGFDGQNVECFRKCYQCGKEWNETIRYEYHNNRAGSNVYQIDGRRYAIVVSQKAPGVVVDRSVYEWDFEKRQLRRNSGLCWGY